MTWENFDYDHSSSWTSMQASTWDGSPWWGADDAPCWSYRDNVGWLYIRDDGLCWQYFTGDSTYSHGNGYGFGQWHLVDPSLPSESLDAESTATAAAAVEIETSLEL